MPQPSDDGVPPSMPRWVKIFGVIGVVLIIIVIIVLLIGGNHGPRRHFGFMSTMIQRVVTSYEIHGL